MVGIPRVSLISSFLTYHRASSIVRRIVSSSIFFMFDLAAMGKDCFKFASAIESVAIAAFT